MLGAAMMALLQWQFIKQLAENNHFILSVSKFMHSALML